MERDKLERLLSYFTKLEAKLWIDVWYKGNLEKFNELWDVLTCVYLVKKFLGEDEKH